ncbi:MAG: methyltransferase domain-containing protein [Candidatus Binataceae bacterium]
MLQRFLLKAENLFWERRLGINTRGSHAEEGGLGEHHYYATVPYRSLFDMLKRLEMQPSDVFADLGSGKGRVVCCAALRPIKEVIGVDYNEQLCEMARRNASRMRGARAGVSIIGKRAEEFDYNRANIYYLFNPFGRKTFSEVVAKMAATTAARAQPIRIVYSNPEYEDILAAAPWLECYLRIKPASALEPDMSFWRSRT